MDYSPDVAVPQEQGVDGLNLMVALFAAACAAVLVSFLWYLFVRVTGYQVGWIAIGVGWIVGQAVVVGAGGRKGMSLALISVIATALAMVVSEYLIIHHLVATELAKNGEELALLQPPALMAEVVIASVKEDPATLFFWFIAVGQAFVIPFRK